MCSSGYVYAQAMLIHLKDGGTQLLLTEKVDYIDFLTKNQTDDIAILGKWHLGWIGIRNSFIKYDGTETMEFFMNGTMEWAGRADGQEIYNVSYNSDKTILTATSISKPGKIEVFYIAENSPEVISLEMGGVFRYFYPSMEAAVIAGRPGLNGNFKPEPTHTETSDINEILRYAYGNTASNITPMGTHFVGAYKASTDELNWLADAANEPDKVANLTTWKQMDATLYPFGEPLPADVNQHAIGDCSLCADLASLAYIYPDFIKSIIKDNGDGTYIVDMFDPEGNKIKVAVRNTFLCDRNGTIGQVTGKNNVPTWATILEKAVIKWQTVFRVDNIEGIGSEFALPLFTGNGESFAFVPNALHASEMAIAVKWMLDNGRITIGGFDEDNLVCGQLSSVTAHAFTFMYPRYAESLFVMRNPWGIQSVDGVLDIPNERRVTQAIDIRTINPGAAAPYKKADLGAYEIPKFKAMPTDIGVSERICSKRYLLELNQKKH